MTSLTNAQKKDAATKDQLIEGYVQEEIEERPKVEIPQQFEFYKVPRRFGSIPVDELPRGCDKDEQYYKVYPRVSLPFQRVERISFGHPQLEPNRLFWGDDLHVMRMLPSNSIDLIYIDPPFFSGRNYNIIFGDQNEVRSFTDIWEGGMPGYLIWLNARLLEMKRLLKRTGTIYVHLDYHASHYVKAEMDKIFGYENFQSEIIWKRVTTHSDAKRFAIIHDNILSYSKGSDIIWNSQFKEHDERYLKTHYTGIDPKGRRFRLDNATAAGPGPPRVFNGKMLKPPSGTHWRWSQERINQLIADGRIVFTSTGKPAYKRYLDETKGTSVQSIWDDIPPVNSQAEERIGYPTQKPEELLKRIIQASSKEDQIVADFFCGGGTTPVVAQRLGRRWIACDMSRIAVAVTADRILKGADQSFRNAKPTTMTRSSQTSLSPVPDMSLEYWGTYEVPSLVRLSDEEFRHFIVTAYDGRVATGEDLIHGYKNGVPLHVGPASQDATITKDDVIEFAHAIVTRKGKHHGEMLAWAFTPSAQKAADELGAQQAVAVDFVTLSLVPIESDKFSEHVRKHKEYANLLRFVVPPEVRLTYKRLGPLTYSFDISESVSLNPGGRITHVQWDFDHKTQFKSTRGYAFVRGTENTPVLTASYEFPRAGKTRIACKVQDDLGGEKTHVAEVEVR
jgi:DNA modification methylase